MSTLASQTPGRTDALFEDQTYSKVTWRLIPFLCLCFVIAFLDRVDVSFAKLQMVADLKFSEATYGLGAGIFFLAYFLFEVPSNVVMHKVGARRWIARIMITWAILTGLMATDIALYVIAGFLVMAGAIVLALPCDLTRR